MRYYLIPFVLVAMVTILTGCNTTSTSPNAKKILLQPTLPRQIEAGLSNYSARVRSVSSPPVLHQPDDMKISSNVLYIDPESAYAIKQFKSVWASLKTKPKVVWVNTTEKKAHQVWISEGYNENPLPSSLTFYTTKSIPEPDAYHLSDKGWMELPGVLKSDQTKYWTTFFNGTH